MLPHGWRIFTCEYKLPHRTALLISMPVMHSALPCWSVGSTSNTRSAATTLLVEQKTRSTRFLLKELLEVCTFSSCVSSADKHLLSVVTRELCKFNVHGNPCKTQTIIELTIAAVPKASDAGVLNMEEAITQQKNVLDSVMPAPSSVKPIQGAVDTSATVSATWGPLLQKIKLFSELVDSIAEVRD
jgi:hypothetical protein